MALRDIELRTFVILAHSEVKVLEKVLMKMLVCSVIAGYSAVTPVQIISHLDSQIKFQMFTLFSGRNIGVPRRYINTAALYRPL